MPLESRAVEGSPRLPLKLECLLGRGAAGEVWKARSPFGFVAVKCIDLAQRSKDSELATQEAWLLQRIRHPHIVRFLDLVVDKGQMRIVMQLMEGDLAQAITRRREMSLDGFPEAPAPFQCVGLPSQGENSTPGCETREHLPLQEQRCDSG